jgi:NAD(P)-dependent dehydrogenase (short-subunit alcohol dehydrogenase family)
MRGKICIVTGSTSGIGKATAGRLARAGATVVVVGRSPAKLEAAVAELRPDAGAGSLETLTTDLASLDAVRRLADDFRRRHDRLDVLVNNAFDFVPTREETVDGHERIFATNYLAPFLLTNLLLPLLKASAPARIVNVAAPQYGARIAFDDLQGARSFNPHRQNLQAKLALVMFTYELARRLDGSGVTVNCLTPGLVNTRAGSGGYPGFTGVVYRLLKPVMKNAEQGSETPFHLAASPEVEGVSGRYFANRKERRSSTASYDEAAAKRLWDVSEQLTGLEERRLAA